MARETRSVTIDDLSVFTKTLRNHLLKQDKIPGHAAMLSVVAKAAGYDNYQHLKATKQGTPNKRLDRAVRVFERGVMVRWPKQTAVQGLCMWVFWARLPARTDFSETDVNMILKAGHSFGDHALLRRSLIDHRLAERSSDGKTYRRVERAPPPEAIALIKSAQRPS